MVTGELLDGKVELSQTSRSLEKDLYFCIQTGDKGSGNVICAVCSGIAAGEKDSACREIMGSPDSVLETIGK